ncbi:PREDICTED: uncharacterized protein LOC109156328 [Ipomoea nil]|uniref:uncharacterized protein LOC109156328 n=1 Tax=Ipomoea nil TaxID=35883 RepID=UPI000901F78E|nr:PREDICTED: uncharacterized protein LOC109156328 [Ipomoea nil]
MEKETTRDYIPHLVSIGPNHYGNPKLSDMETQKTELLDLESREWNSQKASSLTNALLELEEKTRKCYPHSFNHMDGDAFVRMMLTDAFFLINLFTDYPKFRKVPFFILAKVYVILTDNESADSLKKLALQFFKQLVPFGKAAESSTSRSPENPKHLLDLFHSSFVTQKDRSEESTTNPSSHKMETKFWVDNASTLRSKGVTFIAREARRIMPLDIEFSWLGLLRIPTLYIDERNMRVLKSLLAYEQGSREVKPYFSCLAVFFSNIATTKRDVKLLREAGIIQHQLHSDKKVVSLFQELYEAVEYSSDEDCLLKCEVERINRFAAAFVPGKFISYAKRILLANFVPFVVLFVTLFLSLSPADTLKPFRIRA